MPSKNSLVGWERQRISITFGFLISLARLLLPATSKRLLESAIKKGVPLVRETKKHISHYTRNQDDDLSV